MSDPPVPLSGSTLVLGPSGVGKTRLTARALEAWVRERGPEGVVLFEFGPAFEHEGRVLGRPVTRYADVPDAVWCGSLDAHAPRAEGATDEEAVALAASNAERAADLLSDAPPNPSAVFVDDATIPFQHPAGDPGDLTGYCDRAEAAVCNAFESDELGTDDPVSRRERASLDALRAWADRVVDLD